MPKDNVSISSSGSSEDDNPNKSSGGESVKSAKNHEDSFLSHVKQKKKIKYDN